MSILEFSKQKEEKQIEVFYNWGNPELTFKWGCVQAQEVFAERGLRVFKTCANGGNFLKGYDDEECIFVTGLIDQDMTTYEFRDFIQGKTMARFDNVDLGNVRIIIITARQIPLKWDFHTDEEYESIFYWYADIDHLYEVQQSGAAETTILEYEVERNKYPTHITVHKSVDLDGISILQSRQHGRLFEELPIMDKIEGTEAEKIELRELLSWHSAFDKRKMAAILDVLYAPVPINDAQKLLKKLDYYYYIGYIHNYRDLGCYFMYDIKDSTEQVKYSLYFDFHAYGVDIDDSGRAFNCQSKLDYVTKYGYICGLSSDGHQSRFDD